MTSRWLVLARGGLALAALTFAGPALAGSHHRVPRQCIDRPVPFSWAGIWFNPQPRPNGCAPPVFAGGEYVGQDPDPFIQLQLARDPETGYAYDLAH
jgi:hypothetical protein